MGNYLAVLKKYAVFKGRASRREYWYFYLMNLIIIGLCYLIFVAMGGFKIGGAYDPVLWFIIIAMIYFLAIIVPQVAITVRRLHDTNRSAWWLLITFVPYIGGLIFLILMVLASTPGENKYGPNPKGVMAS
ncbi:MAG TPA: DUF805 domain-containing protein [Candidatus Paceibacterota bacterium]